MTGDGGVRDSYASNTSNASMVTVLPVCMWVENYSTLQPLTGEVRPVTVCSKRRGKLFDRACLVIEGMVMSLG